jgi:hypothetical protein
MLKSMHEERQQPADSAATEPAPGPADDEEGSPPPDASYDLLRRHFHQHEDEQRRQVSLTDRIIDQLQSGRWISQPSGWNPLQAELRLQCPIDGRTAGRFQVVNESDRALEVAFRPGRFRGAPAAWSTRFPVSFQPAHPHLEPGEEMIVRLAIDVAGCPLREQDRLEFPVDVVGGGKLLQKLWVTVELCPPPEGPGPAEEER